MTAEEVIKLIQAMEPAEIEHLLVLIKDYEFEVRRRQASVRCGGDKKEFEKITDTVFSENKVLFKKLAVFERKERETSAQRPITP